MIFRGEKPPIDTDDGPVLIVDDQLNSRVRELTAKQFSQWGYAVLVTQDAGMALALSEEINPALVIVGEITVATDVPTFLFELKTRMKEKLPRISILVGTWPYRGVDCESYPIISISPLISVNELLNITDDLCAA
ncbi:MAG: response regulator [Deltaproteobacteria bacterium]|nr:response regulator [Deltaproteobacteria bacterium]